jgi:hypothetical protein
VPILLKHDSVQSYPLSKKPIRCPKIFAHEFGGPRGPRIFTAHRQAYLHGGCPRPTRKNQSNSRINMWIPPR